MKLSTRSRYGLRALLDLYLHMEDAPVSLAEIAKRQGLSYSYLETLFATLKRMKLVEGVAGVTGGYRTLRPAEEVTAGEVLRGLEGNLSMAGIQADELPALRAFLNRRVWDQVDDQVDDLLDHTTLQAILDHAPGREQQNSEACS